MRGEEGEGKMAFDSNLDIFVLTQSNYHFSKIVPHIAYFCLITGVCFIFLPACFLSRAKTMSEVLSKKPISFFQLIPHLQWHRPINCCFIFRPQLGQILLPLISIPQTNIHYSGELDLPVVQAGLYPGCLKDTPDTRVGQILCLAK